MLVLFAGGVATGIGLLYLRLWARLSILVFSGALILIFGFSAVTIWLTPFPQAGAPPAVATAMKTGVSVFYGVFVLFGAGWLYFFNRKAIKQQFKSPDPGALIVKVVAGFFLLSAATMFVIAFLPFPANFLGLVVAGTPGHFLNAAFGMIALATAIGLLRLKSWAPPVAIAFCVFYGLSSVLFIALPGYSQRMSTWRGLLPPGLRTEQSANPSSQMMIMLLMSTLIYAIPIWFLVRRRAAFSSAPPADTQSGPF